MASARPSGSHPETASRRGWPPWWMWIWLVILIAFVTTVAVVDYVYLR